MRIKGQLPAILAAGIGGAVALGVGLVGMDSERQVARLQLEHRIDTEFADINQRLAESFSALAMLRMFFEASTQPISRAEFHHVSEPFRRTTAGVQLIGWAPRITLSDREGFEHAMRDAGLAGFEIRERPAAAAEMQRAADRPVYYPLLYEEAAKGTAFQVLGWDLASKAIRASAIDAAIAANALAATRPYPMRQPGQPIGVVACVPVFRPHAESPTGAVLPDGVVFGVFHLAQMLDGIVAEKHSLGDLDTYVIDPAGTPGHRLAYWHAGDGRPGPPPQEAMLQDQPHGTARVQLLNQRLEAFVVPVGGAALHRWAWSVIEPSAVVLFLTAIITLYLVLSSLRRQQLDALAETLRDTTDGLQRKADTIAHMARHDALTGLPNRIFFADALARHVTEFSPCAILQVGLDRFKAVNEFHGHAAGDAVLREVAKRLRAITRSDAVVARLGGDEFAIIVDHAAAVEAGMAIARRLIDAISLPIATVHGDVAIGCSIGLACFPSDGADAEKLLHAADLAMDTAKRQDRGSLCQFEPGMDEDVRSRLALEADLRQAIEAGDIRPYYQPVVRLQDATLVGFEILARWPHATRGMVMPDSFITLAESTGLIGELTYSLLRRAAKDAKTWPAHLYLALNISPIHLKRPELPDDLLSILQKSGFEAARLEVEITESALVSSMEIAKTSLLRLQSAGVRVALDDFGTGYSSLVHLRQLPLNKVKIDRSFVSHLLEDAENGKIVAAIVGLGKSLGIATTAEGIETKDVAVCLAGMGCDYGQGYFFAKPMVPEAAAKLYGFDAVSVASKRPERGERLQMSGGAGR
jgi:diguanylate cyclase (GGDEF)-like protein